MPPPHPHAHSVTRVMSREKRDLLPETSSVRGDALVGSHAQGDMSHESREGVVRVDTAPALVQHPSNTGASRAMGTGWVEAVV